MFSHVMIGSDDIARSKSFYDALFAALGAKPGVTDPMGRLVYVHAGSVFMVTKPIDGASASAGNGSTLGFAVSGPEQAEAWHRAGMEHGGAAIENPPGVREALGRRMFLAYLRDPDGNKLCALHRMPAAA